MNALATTFSNIKLRENNKRALVLHLALSFMAYFSGVLWGDLTNDMLAQSLPIATTVFAYILCGYYFLAVTKEKPLLSLVWLTCMTIVVGILSAIGYMILAAVGFSSSLLLEAIAGILLGSALFLNTLSFLVLAHFGAFYPLFNPAWGFLLIAAAPFLPPVLLYAGMRLRIWQQQGAGGSLCKSTLSGEEADHS